MTYILIVLLIIPSLYTLSYAKYCWHRNNKKAPVGAVLLSLSSITIPAVLTFIKR